ncbi:radical SAM protein [Candidatus Methanocrinis natronophilus]|uniref:Radical SAM protein n=1 Tax=Candidatus Methanocrinis natronophilus TaxID=3033396 RepID=A0ABT5XAV1_9EURY|nr:radical SAM protein [Candidatus Methanocrinis natronophilus]MDF0591786.1 radical SAM protein [Candidatus Methanocrinis natronophilus]
MTSPSAVAIPDQFRAEGFRFVKLGSSGEALKRPIETDWSTTANYPHDDPALLQHLRRGANYGIVNGTGPNGAGLVTLDADNLPRLMELIDFSLLPSTLEAGRRGEDGEPIPERRHFHCLSDLEGKHLLRDPETGEDLGDLRGSGGYQVVGPGSLHPSGARVEILEDRPLAYVSGEELLRILAPVLEAKTDTDRAKLEGLTKKRPPTTTDKDPFGDVSILDVIDVTGFKESGGQFFGEHHIHGSETGHNLVVSPAKDSWWCGRHQTGGGPALWLAVEGRIIDCSEARSGALRGEKFLQTLDYARSRGLIPTGDDEAGGTGKSRGPSMATRLVDLALSSGATFWRSPEGEAFVTFPTAAGHSENHLLRSKVAKTWLSGLLYDADGRAPKGSAVADALTVLGGRSIHGGEAHPVFVRLAECDDRIYLDLGGDDWRAVEIGTDGWRVISSDAVPVKFRRAKGLLPLPVPRRGGSLDDLRAILNIPEGDPWMLVQAWLIQAFRPTGPYPALIVNGEQGSGKSWLGRILRYVIDPNKSPLRRPPRGEHDLMIAAANSWLVVLDNLSGLPPWLGDALCVISTGGGLSCRELYTDSEEALFDLQRPVILNGIDAITTRGDLLGRAILLQLPRIDGAARRTEKEILAELDRIRPGVLGAILDVISSGLRELPTVQLASMPRMADFAEWVVACEEALGWEPGEFLAAFEENQAEAEVSLIDGDMFIAALVEFTEGGVEAFEGTAGFLLAALDERAGFTSGWRPDGWPRTARGAANKLRRFSPALRAVGREVTFKTGHRKARLIDIRRRIASGKDPIASIASSETAAGGTGGDGGAQLPTPYYSDPKEEIRKKERKRGEGERGREVGDSPPPRTPCTPPPAAASGSAGGDRGGDGVHGGDTEAVDGASKPDDRQTIAENLEEARRREADHLAKFTTPEPKVSDGVAREYSRAKKDGPSSPIVYTIEKKGAERSATKTDGGEAAERSNAKKDGAEEEDHPPVGRPPPKNGGPSSDRSDAKKPGDGGEARLLKAIYAPKGRADEYAGLALNLYRGCGHGCAYCYNRDRFPGAGSERIKKSSLEAIGADLKTLEARGERGPVHLSFVGDPYDLARGEDDTRAVLELFHKSGVNFQVLTKGGMKAARDFDLYRPGDKFGCTLTFLDPVKSREWEPGAALPDDRLKALEEAQKRGLETWASLEPVIDPAETLELIRRSSGFVDHFKVGKWNHDKRTDGIDWRQFASDVVALLDSLGCDYYIKDDLRRYLPAERSAPKKNDNEEGRVFGLTHAYYRDLQRQTGGLSIKVLMDNQGWDRDRADIAMGLLRAAGVVG